MADRFRISNAWDQSLPGYKLAVPTLLHHAGLPQGFFQPEKIFATMSANFYHFAQRLFKE